MARPLRIEFAGALYHVTSRGDGRFNWEIHAYCQMSNHYHLLVETPDGNLAQGMRQLNGVYTHGFNWAHQRAGMSFKGATKRSWSNEMPICSSFRVTLS